MTPVEGGSYDVVVLGAGSGGYACALRAAQLGLRVALVEQAEVGGTCLHRGCIPTKALLHVAEVADAAREGSRIGVRSLVQSIDVPAVRAYQDRVVGRLHKGLQGLLTAQRVHCLTGRGRLSSPTTVEVGSQTLTGRHLVLATGSQARSLPGVPVGGPVVTSDEALRLDAVPGSVLVLGGGVIGCEFASIFRSFEAEVTLVEALPRLLAAEDEAISARLERAFRRRGIAVRTEVCVASVDPSEQGVTATLTDGTTLAADLLLVAVGRSPVTADLGYEEAGVHLQDGYVSTDERLRTSVPHTYALGDLVRGPQLAHRGFAHGIFVAEDIAGLRPAPVADTDIPRVTYCDPQVASVGLTEAEATAKYGQATGYEYDLAGNGKSQILGTQGLVKLVQGPDDRVVGVHMIGARMGEQVGEAQLLVGWDAVPADVAGLVHAHPTQGEALGEASLALAGKPLHAHV